MLLIHHDEDKRIIGISFSIITSLSPSKWPTIGALDPIEHGHSIASNILAAFGNPVLSCKHSGENPF